jgi:hypothetical protein
LPCWRFPETEPPLPDRAFPQIAPRLRASAAGGDVTADAAGQARLGDALRFHLSGHLVSFVGESFSCWHERNFSGSGEKENNFQWPHPGKDLRRSFRCAIFLAVASLAARETVAFHYGRRLYVMSEREAYRQKVEAQIEEQRAKLDQLKARAKQAVAEGKIKAHEELDEVERKLEAAKARLKELSEASESTWEKMKGGFEGAWHGVTEAWRKAVDKFK